MSEKKALSLLKIFKKFKNLVHNKEKKKTHRSMCMESYFMDQPAMSFEDYEFLHLAATNEKHVKGSEQNQLPLKFVVSISLMLCGAFVMFATPVCPVLGYAGEMMITTGFGMLVDQSLDVYQKQ